MPSYRLQLSQSGFTGIELLIVLTVIAIIALLVTNNIQEALAKGRDIERRSEINAIRDKLEEHWHANESYPADFTPLSLPAETLTDPSGNLILISPATASANKPASSYIQTSSRPTQEYTYVPYNCGSAANAPGNIDAGEEPGGVDETDTQAGETSNLVIGANEAEATLSECRNYVLYSWLEKAEVSEIPYEVNNQHTSL